MLLLYNMKCAFVFNHILMGSTFLAQHVQLDTKEIATNVTFKSQEEFVDYEIKRRGNCGDDKDTAISNMEDPQILERKKRWITVGFCMNFPLCCDIRGKDRCGFFCPVCPVKRDYCKYFLNY